MKKNTLNKWSHAGVDIWYRAQTDDELILQELLVQDMYHFEQLSHLVAFEKGSVLIDVGAHIGVFSKLWRQWNPDAMIVCYEPIDSNFELLLKNNTGAKIDCRKMAVAPSGGSGKLTLSKAEHTGRWRLQQLHAQDGQQQEASLIPINEAIREFANNPIILKMDVEGLEYDLLNAFDDSAWNNICMLILEWHELPMPHTFFEEKGFCLLFHPKAQERHVIYIRPKNSLHWIQTYTQVSRTLVRAENNLKLKKVLDESQWSVSNLLRRLRSRLRRLVD
jgi:FkbM family methyltransferase